MKQGKGEQEPSAFVIWVANGCFFSRISRSLLVNCQQIQQVSRTDREKTQVFFKDIAEPLTLSRLEFRRLRSFVQHPRPA
jgi:DNA-binding LytR/AlgR family response regulator